MIDESTLERAMDYLSDTDVECAALKADVHRSEYLAKVAEALAFQLAEGSIEAKKAEAKRVTTVQDAWEKHFSAMQAYEIVRAKRERAVLTVEVWRSMNANRRQAA